MTSISIPASMDEITPEWLTAALRKSGHLRAARVIEAPRQRIGEGVGILGELARITLVYDREEAGAPKTLIAKIPTADPGGRGVAHMLGFYEKERRIYDELADQIGVRSPRSYYAGGDPETVRYVILMEDLAGLRLGDQVQGASLEECATLVREVARLHARWWNSPDLDALAWIPRGNDPVNLMAAVAFAQAVEPFLRTFGSDLTDFERELVLRYMHRMNPMQDRFSSTPETLCHGDLRLDNVFFGSPDGSAPLTFVDWQIAVRARGPYDIGYFMSQSVDPSLRRGYERELVHTYHESLVANGVRNYAWEQCWDDYRMTVMWCLTYPVVAAGSIDLANERGVELARAMLRRALSAIHDLQAYEVLETLEERPHPLLVEAAGRQG
jgi:hypothetical protein